MAQTTIERAPIFLVVAILVVLTGVWRVVGYFAPSIIFPYFIITSPIARIISPRIWIILGESLGAGVIIGPL